MPRDVLFQLEEVTNFRTGEGGTADGFGFPKLFLLFHFFLFNIVLSLILNFK